MIKKKNNKFNSRNSIPDNKHIDRPTSPHLQIYRWNLSSLTSIFHRATGIALYFSVIIIAWFIVYYSTRINIGESETCECLLMSIIHNLFILAIILITFSLFYHYCNGIRHLFWDIGKGYDLKVANRNSIIVIFSSLALTIITILACLYLKFF
jgi:succinate dehydrogenase / fumarate reductase cytochrome b subunit